MRLGALHLFTSAFSEDTQVAGQMVDLSTVVRPFGHRVHWETVTIVH